MPNKSLGAKLKSRCSILLVPSDGGRHRQFEFSPTLMLCAAGAGVALLAAAFFVFSGGAHRMQARQLAMKNQAMVEELAGIRKQVASLEAR